MKIIVITGPSGSGKSFLSSKLSKLFDNSILIKTDSYYRDNVLIKFLSIFYYDIYDRIFSIRKKEIVNTLISINNKDKLINFYKYDFKRKKSTKCKLAIKYNNEKQFLILEGVFAHRLNINYKETINIICEEKKDICYKRRLTRDKLERGRNTREVKRKFNTSWNLFYQNVHTYQNRNKVIALNTINKNSFNKLVYYLKKNN